MKDKHKEKPERERESKERPRERDKGDYESDLRKEVDKLAGSFRETPPKGKAQAEKRIHEMFERVATKHGKSTKEVARDGLSFWEDHW